MRLTLFSMLLVSCSTMDLDGALVHQGDWAQIPERARVLHMGEGRLDPDGPSLFNEKPEDTAGPRWNHELVVMEHGEEIGVMVPLAEVSLLVYLDRDDLQSRVVEPIEVDGVQLEIDLEVSVLDEEEDQVRVVFGDDDVQAEAWVPRSGIDQVWTSTLAEKEALPGGDVWLRGATAILDHPDGQAFAWTDAFSWNGELEPTIYWLPATALGEAQDGYQEIIVERDGFSLHGFVSIDNLAENSNGGRGRSSSSGCRVGTSDTAPISEATVPPGTDLYLDPGGRWIGRTHSPIYRELDGSSEDIWRSIEIETPWGLATAWLEIDSD